MDAASQWIALARILRPQGRKGEVLADLLTDFPERFDQHRRVWLAPPGFAEQSSGGESVADRAAAGVTKTSSGKIREAEVAAHWLPVGRNAGRIVLRFAGVETIEQAEELADREVVVPIAERLPLDADAAYISDLLGATVYDRGIAVGVVEDVQFATTPDGTRRLEEAAPLLAVRSPEGEEILVPFANAFLLELDVEGKAIRMVLPEGLVEINRVAGK